MEEPAVFIERLLFYLSAKNQGQKDKHDNDEARRKAGIT